MQLYPIALDSPLTGHREIEMAAEAAAAELNVPASRHTQMFLNRLSALSRQRYSLGLSSGHAALYGAFLGLGLRSGDEVLVPEIADASVAAAVVHAGGTPVFCDVEPETLCLSASAAQTRISLRTRCVVAVHLYGQMCDMEALRALALENGISLVEYATGGLGAEREGHVAGATGVFSVFTFGPGDPLVAGGGAVLLSSSEPHIARAAAYTTRSGEDRGILSFDCELSPLQAAVGLAQLERLSEVLEARKAAFSAYQEALRGIPGLVLQPDVPGSRNSRLMVVLRLEDGAPSRDAVLRELREAGVMAAPVFAPLSSMKAFAGAENSVAYREGTRALLLPGGCRRTGEEIAYVCDVLKKIVNVDAPPPRLTGWLKNRSDTLERIAAIKKDGLTVPFTHDGVSYVLSAVRSADAEKPALLRFMASLRVRNKHALLSYCGDEMESTQGIMARYVQDGSDFLLFFVIQDKTIWGHVGLDSFDFKEPSCKVEALMMADNPPKGLAAAANLALHEFAAREFGLRRIYTHVVGGNTKSRILGRSLGFKVVNSVSLYRKDIPDGALHLPMYIMGREKPVESFVLSVKEFSER